MTMRGFRGTFLIAIDSNHLPEIVDVEHLRGFLESAVEMESIQAASNNGIKLKLLLEEFVEMRPEDVKRHFDGYPEKFTKPSKSLLSLFSDDRRIAQDTGYTATLQTALGLLIECHDKQFEWITSECRTKRSHLIVELRSLIRKHGRDCPLSNFF